MFWVTGLLGLAFIVAPFVFGYNDTPEALWTSVVVGVVIALASGIKAYLHDRMQWEYWVAGAAGLVAIAAPFVLEFNTIDAALWTSLALGILTAGAAGYEAVVHPEGA